MRQYSVTYLKCQSCTAKNHCEDCGAELRERLLGIPGVRALEIDVPARRLSVDYAGADEWALLDEMEEAGVFAD